jgi:hypothetical protein
MSLELKSQVVQATPVPEFYPAPTLVLVALVAMIFLARRGEKKQ